MSSGRNSLVQLMSGENLSAEQAYVMMNAVMVGEIPAAQLAGILVALQIKGETVDEITGFARAMRENATAVQPQRTDLIDTCGTGGDGSGTFNISTATAIVAASMGCGVAKHGNRAVSSNCGSADVLEHMGVDINLTAIQAAEMVDFVGLGFLFAPSLHPAMKHAMPARKELGIRTVFNVLGPLTNPAGAKRQLLGVFEANLCEKMAHVLNELGSEKAFVVHGKGGLDEVSLTGITQIAALSDGAVTMSEFHPSEAGLEVCQPEDLQGGDVMKNAAIIEAVLTNEPGPCADIVVLNAAFVAVLADLAPDVKTGVELAREKIADGSAIRVLDILRTAQT